MFWQHAFVGLFVCKITAKVGDANLMKFSGNVDNLGTRNR